MFDSLYDRDGTEWQTKAFGCDLAGYRVGDQLPAAPFDYQLKVLGGEHHLNYLYSYATVSAGYLASVNDPRDETLPLLDYYGGWIPASKGA